MELCRTAWRVHYRIPRRVWPVVIGLLAVTSWASSSFDFGINDTRWPEVRNTIWAVSLAVSVVAFARWSIDRWNTRHGLALTVFWSTDPSLSRELQNRIATYLNDVLSPQAAKRVNRLPVIVSGADRAQALSLLRGLRASYVLYGDIFDASGKAIAEPHILKRVTRTIIHMDLFLRDITPSFTRRSELVYRLATTSEVKEYELPPEFGKELRALIALLASDAAQLASDPSESIRFLRSALHECHDAETPTVDAMTADLARLVETQEGPGQALALVRQRADRHSPLPAPDLLRAAHEFAFKLSVVTDDEYAVALRELGVSWLRRAASQEADPERDVTLYNLALAVDADSEGFPQEESLRLLVQVLSMSPFYRRAWYAHRQLGSHFWRRHLHSDTPDGVRWAKRSARHYARAIRRRPRARWFYLDHNGIFSLRKTFERLPIMYANTADAHIAAGHSLRGNVRRTQAFRERRRMIKIATDAAERGEWERAYAYFDWCRIGWSDTDDLLAHVASALSGERINLPARLIQRAWDDAYARFPESVDELRTALEKRWA